MDKNEMVEFYARIYNTIQEMVWTGENNWIYLWVLKNYLDNINNQFGVWCLWDIDTTYTKEQQEKFLELTDRIENRIYFNC